MTTPEPLSTEQKIRAEAVRAVARVLAGTGQNPGPYMVHLAAEVAAFIKTGAKP